MRLTLPTADSAVLVVTLLVISCTSNAQVDEPVGSVATIDLREATERALHRNPVLRAAGFDIDAELARRDAASLSSPYTIAAEIENFAGTGSLAGFDSAETTVGMTKVLELGGKRRAREALGDARVDLARTDADIVQQRLAVDVARRYLEVLIGQERLTLVGDAQALHEHTRAVVRKLVAAGRASEAELADASVSVQLADVERDGIEYRLEASRRALATLWGSTSVDFVRVEGKAGPLPPLPSHAMLESRLLSNPDLRRMERQLHVLDAARDIADAQQLPDVEFGAGVRHLAAPDDTALVLSFSLPFGSKGRADPAIRESVAMSARLPEQQQAKLLELKAELFSRYQSLCAAHTRYRKLTVDVIPEAEKSVRLYEHGFELGSSRLVELTAAQKRMLALREEALLAAADFHRALIEIEFLLGEERPGGGLQ